MDSNDETEENNVLRQGVGGLRKYAILAHDSQYRVVQTSDSFF